MAKDEVSPSVTVPSNIIDSGRSGTQLWRIGMDVNEMAGTSLQLQFYSRETETDAWQLMGGIGANAVDSQGEFHFEGFRYIKMEWAVSGSDLVAGATAIGT